MNIRDRIRDFRRVKAADLRPSPRNWRRHPEAQQNALRGVLSEIGIADALLARELEDGTLELVDGHLRADTSPDTEWPVLVLDVDRAEADKLLATLDPLAAMAEADEQKLGELLHDLETDSEALDAMLRDLGDQHGVDIFTPAAADMPDLPNGDREPFQQMTFTLSDAQAADVKAALEAAKKAGPFVDTGNENSNGNALARVVEAYLGQG